MKKNMIALAVAAAFAAPVAMADAPVVYGKLNLNINATEGKDASVNSTASRLGIKGSEDLGNGLKAVYKLEFALNDVADTSGKPALTARNQYLGLAGGFGTVLMGRHDTPLKMSQPSDLFNDGAADSFKSHMAGTVTTGETRATDVLAIVSPSFSGVKVMAAKVVGGTSANADANSFAITYGSKKKGLYLAAAKTTATGVDLTRLSAQYKANGLTVNVMNQNDDTNDYTVVQAAYKMGKFMPKVKYSTGNDNAATAIGVNYSLGKKTVAYVYGVSSDNAADATIVGMAHSF